MTAPSRSNQVALLRLALADVERARNCAAINGAHKAAALAALTANELRATIETLTTGESDNGTN